MLIIDAHEDLAYNMLTYGRDYTRSAAETRRLEAGTIQVKVKEDTLLGWPDYQRGQVAVIFSTLFATPTRLRSGDWERLHYANTLQANHLYWEQLDLYHRLVDDNPDKFRLVWLRSNLQEILAGWQKSPETKGEPPNHPVGLVILMEGAEGLRAMSELEDWWDGGVRIIGPAWAGNRFCGGTREPGRLTVAGRELLEHMAGHGFGLDVSHMDEVAALEAVDSYPGVVIASHSNAKALLRGYDGNRHLSDALIQALVERNAVIGVLPFNGFLQADWKQGERRDLVTLQHVAAQIDYICQMAGDSRHVGIGSDFDGGFGLQSVPVEIDTIASLQTLVPLLGERGYSQEDIQGILGGNWITMLNLILPD